MEKHTAYISIGSNIGDKLLNCQKGISALTKSGRSVIIGQSNFYKTEPADYTDQDWFVNSAVKIETTLDPFQLLYELKIIEKHAGRTEDPIRYGPRILDLDVIFYDDIVINSSKLIIPHPEMHKRRFVLKPICDIDSKLVHPVLKMDMQYLLDNLIKG
ncbi:MAG: 2-amino-4-hydroxy-6-hydroxymethyldihydropteridine diphosphokinase [Proteobacteria bacterium]|nr:2-amino-4-hydroxy-6-hydroxymethyldihydropteridine diphosphokinase [Pseudomonadota bacterium]MBU4287886.1 2-amino-4-hydroxy-6-hydroxymethyldihydropteridine diphosphokinase [Pseudomonadota bacterium]MCG2757524.1 2-amino-4-hydroxy-6-hydroxymethyldihydropteridine diphosphokinase [Desulfobacteraceae bacterium]